MATNTQVLVAMLNAAPGTIYQPYLEATFATAEALAEAIEGTSFFTTMYPTDADFEANFASNLLGAGYDADALATADAFVSDMMASGSTPADVVIAAVEYLTSGSVDAAFEAAAAAMANKVAVAEYMSGEMGSLDTVEITELRAAIANVTDDPATVFEAIGGTDNDEGATFYLTAGQDMISAGAGDDLFIARGNETLNNADILDGGAGTDTVRVMLDAGETAEAPMFTNIEILEVTAQANNAVSGSNDVDGQSDIDAQDMDGVEQFWSVDSRADLVIEDVRRDSTETTIGLRNTDPGEDMHFGLYFSPDNIVAPEAVTLNDGFLEIKLVNVYEAILADAGDATTNALKGFGSLSFSIGEGAAAEEVTIVITDETVVPNVQNITTYAELQTAIEDAITAQFPDLDFTVALGDSTAALSDDVNDVAAGTEVDYNTVSITVADTFISEATFKDVDEFEFEGNNLKDSNDTPNSVDLPALTQTDIILDYVGRGSKSGDVEIGSMSTGAYSGSAGIEQFNIDVDRNSWINILQSTNNTLEVVNVENIGANGSLRIDSLTDVRVFDADTSEGKLSSDMTGMIGDVTLTATLSQEVAEKYLARQDDAADATADNSDIQYNYVVDQEFSYDFGEGDDSLDLSIDSLNLQVAGTGEYEDFVLEVNGGAGDDELMAYSTGMSQNAYSNQKINAALTINGDEGADVIRTGNQETGEGMGDWMVDGGDGADRIYIDNTGANFGQAEAEGDAGFGGDDYYVGSNLDLDGEGDQNNGNAIWVLNAQNTDLNDIQGNEASVVRTSVNAAVEVTFKGLTAVVDLAETIGATTDVAITDLRVNQAIKEAVNNDPVLSALIVAEDGAGRSLVIKSLIDGEMVLADLDVNLIASTTALTAAQVTAGVTTTVTANIADVFGTSTASYVETAAAPDLTITTVGYTVDGSDSTQQQDSTINGGANDAADDVIVLGTNNLTVDGTDEVQTLAFANAAGAASDLEIYYGATLLATIAVGDAGEPDSATEIANAVDTVLSGIAGASVANNGTGTLVVTWPSSLGDVALISVDAIGADIGTTLNTNALTAAGAAVDAAVTAGGVVSTITEFEASNDTVVFEGADFGDETVVNYLTSVAAGTADGILNAGDIAGQDMLDFTAYLGQATKAGYATATGAAVDGTIYFVANDTIANLETAFASNVATEFVVLAQNVDDASVMDVYMGTSVADADTANADIALVGTVDFGEFAATSANFSMYDFV